MTDATTTGKIPALTIVPANEASRDDLRDVFGMRDYPARCQCQRFKTPATRWGMEWVSDSGPTADRFVVERARRLREQTGCGHPEARRTSGLVAYLDGEPVGWCAVEPRTAYVRLGRVPWAGRSEDKAHDSVWTVTCFVTRAGFRRRGISRALARAAVEFARQRGARSLEGYPMITQLGHEVTWGEFHVGSRSIFAGAGFTQVSRPSRRRVVMRIAF